MNATVCIPLKGGILKIDYQDWQKVSKINWFVSSVGYAARGLLRSRKLRSTQLHRILLRPKKHEWIDHINGDRLDNRRANLRICSPAQNLWNRPKHKNNKSGFKGVNWSKAGKKWTARIWVNKKSFYLGLFQTVEEAAFAYQKAAKELHGTFAKF